MRIEQEEPAAPRRSVRPARSRRPSAADAAHQEAVKARRQAEAEEIIGHPQDGVPVASERLRLRRLQKVRMAPQPLHSNPRRTGSNSVLTASAEAVAAEMSALHSSGFETADTVEQSPEVTADTEGTL